MASENDSSSVLTTAGVGANWGVDDVCEYLKEHDVSYDVVHLIRENLSQEELDKIDKIKLSQEELDKIDRIKLSQKELDKMIKIKLSQEFDKIVKFKLCHIRVDLNDQMMVLSLLKKLFDCTRSFKIFNDPIHGHIEMNELLVWIIDTRQFQRLRWIKQMGLTYLVYPGASHNRFEHSLGVAHLAGEFVRTLQRNQTDLNITDVDILCVEIAGLCHDLGHGPFSHLFDGKFMPVINRQNSNDDDSSWKHEKASEDMFDHLVKKNGLNVKFPQYGIHERDIKFIKELIRGEKVQNEFNKDRIENKPFLYEIVSNKRTEIDVDKWDYFARDCYHLGINKTFDHKRFMHFFRVIGKEICCRDKEEANLYDMFRSRANLHRMACQHKIHQNMENMLVEALVKADKYILSTGSDGQKYKMSECWQDMEAYSQLTDNIFFDILSFSRPEMQEASSKPELQQARALLQRIQHRELFRFIDETDSVKDAFNNAIECCKEIMVECKSKEGTSSVSGIDWEYELVGQIVRLDFGMAHQNPVENMKFYNKDNKIEHSVLAASDISIILPQSFMEAKFRLYCKSYDTRVHDVAQQGFDEWCRKKEYRKQKVADNKDARPVPGSSAPKRIDLALICQE